MKEDESKREEGLPNMFSVLMNRKSRENRTHSKVTLEAKVLPDRIGSQLEGSLFHWMSPRFLLPRETC